MHPLLEELQAQGLSKKQIQTILLTIYEWLETNYPIMAQLSRPVLSEEIDLPEQESQLRRA
jgi:hypothetical protein